MTVFSSKISVSDLEQGSQPLNPMIALRVIGYATPFENLP
jgi:hypothetical protein